MMSDFGAPPMVRAQPGAKQKNADDERACARACGRRVRCWRRGVVARAGHGHVVLRRCLSVRASAAGRAYQRGGG